MPSTQKGVMMHTRKTRSQNGFGISNAATSVATMENEYVTREIRGRITWR